ncbi:hypothetical protein ACYATP_07820 [Lactobacillaceae bacterium Melli_B4]
MKAKLLLTLGVLPLLLAGCGNNDGQFSGHPNNLAKVVAKSKQDAKRHSFADETSLQNAKYQPIDAQLIERALNKNQITGAKAQIANQKLRFQGQVKALGKISDGQRVALITAKHQTYAVFAKSYLVKPVRVGKTVTVYGSGLATLPHPHGHQKLGIDDSLINSKTLMFDADQFVAN